MRVQLGAYRKKNSNHLAGVPYCEEIPIPVLELVCTADQIQCFLAWFQTLHRSGQSIDMGQRQCQATYQVVGVVEHNLAIQLLELVRGQALQGALGADGHKHRRTDRPMRECQEGRPCLGGRATGQRFEREGTVHYGKGEGCGRVAYLLRLLYETGTTCSVPRRSPDVFGFKLLF